MKLGLKITKSRLDVFSFFIKSSSPIRVDDIRKVLRIDKVTLYRTIETFLKVNILKKVYFKNNAQYFEINEHHHHHIVCNDCGYIEELDLCNISNILKSAKLNTKNFKTIDEHTLEFYGLCKKCSVL